MAQYAVEFRKQATTFGNGLHSHRRLRGHNNWLGQLMVGRGLNEAVDLLPRAVRERGQIFYVLNRIAALTFAQVGKAWHRTSRHSSSDGLEQILIRRQRSS